MRRPSVPRASAGIVGFDRPVDADRVFGVRALHRIVGEREVARSARERPEMIEARDERKRARARQPPVGRLQPEQPAERGRHADRAVGVGAERERHQPARDRAARAARRAAGHAVRVVRIVRVAVVRVLAGEVVGVFAHVERADQHGAGGFQPLDQRLIVRRRRKLAVDLRPGARRQPFDVEQVLHRERHAGERAERLPGGARVVDRLARLRARSASTSVNELSTGSRAMMRASASSVTWTAETLPAATASAISAALAHDGVHLGLRP